MSPGQFPPLGMQSAPPVSQSRSKSSITPMDPQRPLQSSSSHIPARSALLRAITPLWAFLLFFALPRADADVAVLGSTAQQSTGSTLASFTVNAGSNRVLIVAVGEPGSPTLPSRVTFHNKDMTQITSRSDNFAACDNIWFLKLGTDVSETGDIVVTHSVGTALFIGAAAYSGVDQGASAVTAGPSDGNPSGFNVGSSVDVTSATGDLVFDLFDTFKLPQAAAITTGPGQTRIHDAPMVLSFGNAHYVTSTEAGAASVTMSWTSDAEAILHLSVNIKKFVNVAPTVSNVAKGVNEDVATAFAAGDFTPGSYSDPNGDPLATVKITSLPTNGVLKLSGSTFTVPQDIAIANIGNLTYTSNPDYNGPDSFGWNGSDGTFFATVGATVNVTVNAVNDKPTFTAANPPAVTRNAGAQTVVGWVTNFDPGAANESAQTVLAYTVSNVSNTALFSAGPSVATNGTLTYTPSGTATGTSTFDVKVQDNGGTSPGVDTSDVQTFTITINASNDSSLSALSFSNVTLTVPFAPGTLTYNGNAVVWPISTTATPTVNDAAATVKVNGTTVTSGSPSGSIPLPAGTSDITIVVTAEDLTTTTYTVHVTRPASTNAKLGYLKANLVGVTPDIRVIGTMTPAFAQTTVGYSLKVGNAVSSITVTPTVAHPNATVTVAGTGVTSGTASGALPLAVGPNPILVVVTAESGAQLTYTLTVTRNPVFMGNYDGLAVPVVGAVNPQSDVGLGKVTIGAAAGFSGKFTLGGSTTAVPFSGVFDVDGVARFGAANATTIDLVRAGFPTLTLAMHLDVQFPLTHQVIGTLSDGATQVSDIELNRQLYTSGPPVAPQMNVPVSILDPATDNGSYTAILQSLDPASQGLPASAYPQGDGWMRVTVNASGVVTLGGQLADGTPFACSNNLSKNNRFPFYTPAYSGTVTGSVSGWVEFRNVPAQTDADGLGVRWFKEPNVADATYAAGWSTGIKADFLGSKLVLPAITGNTMLGNAPAVSPAVNALLTLSDGTLAGPLSNQLTLTSSGTIVRQGPPPLATGAAGLYAGFPTGPSANGVFQGGFRFPGTNAVTPFKGVVLQKTTRAAGYFLAPTGGATQESGAVTITAQP